MIFKDGNGTVINITGAIITFTIKAKITDVSALKTATATITDWVGGLAKVEISAANMNSLVTKNYYYDIQFTDVSWVISTIMKWIFAVTYDITT